MPSPKDQIESDKKQALDTTEKGIPRAIGGAYSLAFNLAKMIRKIRQGDKPGLNTGLTGTEEQVAQKLDHVNTLTGAQKLNTASLKKAREVTAKTDAVLGNAYKLNAQAKEALGAGVAKPAEVKPEEPAPQVSKGPKP